MGRANVPHRARPRHVAAEPVLVTLRAMLRSLRSEAIFQVLCRAVARATQRAPERFRVVHFSVQWDHVHMLVEAENQRALSSGMRSLAIRVAAHRSVVSRASIETVKSTRNGDFERDGAVWALPRGAGMLP
jgi:REP element-mobilizing transposase RayT